MTGNEEENRTVVREYLAAFNARNQAVLTDCLAPDVVEHGVHEQLHGPDEILEFLEAHFRMFPDYAGTTDLVVAEDDFVTVRYTVSGTHSGEYRDLEPTGRTAEWSGTAIYRVEDGQIVEIWLEEDRLGLLEQLGVVDPEHVRLRR